MNRSNVIDTGFQDIVAADNLAELSNPLTGPILAATLKDVMIAVLLRAVVGLKVRIGVQFSDNPLQFSDTPKELTTGYWTAAGWNRSNTAVNIFTLSGTTPRLWVRFVALTQAPTGTLAGSAEARLRITPAPVRVQRVPGLWRKANSRGSTSLSATHPVTGSIDVLGFTEQRVLIEVAALSGASA